MFLLSWYREWLEIRNERTCQNCDYFKLQIESLQHRNEQLVRQLTQTDVPPVPVAETREPIKPRFIPWRTRRQMLEQEDAQAAKVMRQKQQEIKSAVVAGKYVAILNSEGSMDEMSPEIILTDIQETVIVYLEQNGYRVQKDKVNGWDVFVVSWFKE